MMKMVDPPEVPGPALLAHAEFIWIERKALDSKKDERKFFYH